MRWLPVAIAGVITAVAAQEAPRPATIRVEAVVTDSAGRPLLDLKPADFELKASGAVQPLASVDLRRASADPAVPRTLALFLDEFHVSAGESADRARRTALEFVDRHVRPGDRLIVMKPLDSQLTIEASSDPASWRQAIDSFEGRAGDFTPRTPFEEQYIGRAPELVRTSRAQIVTSALRAVVVRLGELSSGRSALAFVSEGFADRGRGDREQRLPDLQAVVRLANRAHVAVYSLNPSTAPEEPGDGETVAARLRKLAADTGGETAAGDGLPPALSRMSRDLDSYYVLTFAPTQTAEGRYQRLELTTKRRGAVVRTSAGFWTPISAETLARRDPPPRPIRTLKRSPLIVSWFGLTRLGDGTMRLRVTWEPARRGTGARPREVSQVVVRAARGGGSEALFERTIAQSQLAEAIVPAGRVELDLTVMDAKGQVIDREARDVDVPEPDAPRISTLAPEIIRARTLPEFEAARHDPAATPTPQREFRRTDRLIVRAPAAASATRAVIVSARLLNRWGQPMRELQAVEGPGAGIMQFELPLGWLATGEYELELRTRQGTSDASQRIPVKVIG